MEDKPEVVSHKVEVKDLNNAVPVNVAEINKKLDAPVLKEEEKV